MSIYGYAKGSELVRLLLNTGDWEARSSQGAKVNFAALILPGVSLAPLYRELLTAHTVGGR